MANSNDNSAVNKLSESVYLRLDILEDLFSNAKIENCLERIIVLIDAFKVHFSMNNLRAMSLCATKYTISLWIMDYERNLPWTVNLSWIWVSARPSNTNIDIKK